MNPTLLERLIVSWMLPTAALAILLVVIVVTAIMEHLNKKKGGLKTSKFEKRVSTLCGADDKQLTLGRLYKAHRRHGICTLCKDGDAIAFGTEKESVLLAPEIELTTFAEFIEYLKNLSNEQRKYLRSLILKDQRRRNGTI